MHTMGAVRSPSCRSRVSSTPRTSSGTPTRNWAIRSSRTACLCKNHHTAYDANLLGIDADGIVHISERLLDIHDGPFLELGLKAAAGILLPARDEDHHDRDRLDTRFQAFKCAA